jgi:hypothetical protein
MSGEAFKQARDLLFAHRGNYAAAHRDFRWPAMERFNYALDWFDAELARGPLGNSEALRILGEGATTRSFAQLSADSSRLANGLRGMGVKDLTERTNHRTSPAEREYASWFARHEPPNVRAKATAAGGSPLSE